MRRPKIFTAVAFGWQTTLGGSVSEITQLKTERSYVVRRPGLRPCRMGRKEHATVAGTSAGVTRGTLGYLLHLFAARRASTLLVSWGRNRTRGHRRRVLVTQATGHSCPAVDYCRRRPACIVAARRKRRSRQRPESGALSVRPNVPVSSATAGRKSTKSTSLSRVRTPMAMQLIPGGGRAWRARPPGGERSAVSFPGAGGVAHGQSSGLIIPSSAWSTRRPPHHGLPAAGCWSCASVILSGCSSWLIPFGRRCESAPAPYRKLTGIPTGLTTRRGGRGAWRQGALRHILRLDAARLTVSEIATAGRARTVLRAQRGAHLDSSSDGTATGFVCPTLPVPGVPAREPDHRGGDSIRGRRRPRRLEHGPPPPLDESSHSRLPYVQRCDVPRPALDHAVAGYLAEHGLRRDALHFLVPDRRAEPQIRGLGPSRQLPRSFPAAGYLPQEDGATMRALPPVAIPL